MVVGEPQTIDDAIYANVLAACSAGPEVDRVPAPWWPLKTAQVVEDRPDFASPGWDSSNTELAGAPLGDNVILVGRPAMRWLPGELARLNHLAGILASIL